MVDMNLSNNMTEKNIFLIASDNSTISNYLQNPNSEQFNVIGVRDFIKKKIILGQNDIIRSHSNFSFKELCEVYEINKNRFILCDCYSGICNTINVVPFFNPYNHIDGKYLLNVVNDQNIFKLSHYSIKKDLLKNKNGLTIDVIKSDLNYLNATGNLTSRLAIVNYRICRLDYWSSEKKNRYCYKKRSRAKKQALKR